MTDVTTVIQELETLSSEQIQKIYLRRQPDARALGVRFGDLAKLVKRYKLDTPLAFDLWESASFEARYLACKIVDPKDVTEEIIDRWILEADFPLLADAIAEVVYSAPFADAKRREWTASTGEFVRRAGYSLLHFAASDPNNPILDDELVEYLHTVRVEIHESPNWSREMMNFAPVAIGRRSPALYDKALAAARAYGKIDVFHGDKTNCKISDAVSELENPPKRPVRKATKATT